MVPTKIAGFFFLACRLSPFVSASIHFFLTEFHHVSSLGFFIIKSSDAKKNPLPTFTHDITQILVSTHRGICTQQDLESGLSSASVPR
jgi:hypothetical protein